MADDDDVDYLPRQLSEEIRTDASLKARLNLGKRSEGDTIALEGHGWNIRLTMVRSKAPDGQDRLLISKFLTDCSK